jgi:hypothetical protein
MSHQIIMRKCSIVFKVWRNATYKSKTLVMHFKTHACLRAGTELKKLCF